MLPMFLWTRPEDAESLLGYRYHTLPGAMESAKRFSAKGARYSWMSSDTGFEQCESWDTGCCEIHITADIAYAFYRYNSVISDEKLRNQSAEVLVQTARYWVDRFNYSAQEDRYHLLFVKGPDEYDGVTTDDFYTVCMARDNLQYAAQYVRALPGAQIQALAEKTGLTPQEPALWEEIARKVVLVRDGLLWRQDSTFGYLEPLDIAAAKDGTLTLDKLEAMTCVCSVGLDMIAVPGDTSAETISAIIADEAAIGMVNNKTTAVRLLPTPGKNVGDTVEMGGLLGSAPVMPVHKESSADFIQRGGRIPAPLHSLRN